MQFNPWVLESLKERGIEVLKGGKLRIEFYKGKFQEVKDLPAALRQQQHIIDQQKEEQQENVEIGKMMAEFNNVVVNLKKQTVENLTDKKLNSIFSKLDVILENMEKKKEELRRDGLKRLKNVYKMLEQKNIPAATWASEAALDRMRRRWHVNEKVIDKSYARYEALKNLSV